MHQGGQDCRGGETAGARIKSVARELAEKARALNHDMYRRLGRYPDTADYEAAFEIALRVRQTAEETRKLHEESKS